MKKLLAALLVVLSLMFALTACFETGENGDEGKDPPVIEDDRTVELNETEISLNKGKTFTLVATLSVGKADFVWTSSAPEIASVNENGVVTALTVGKATITATAEGKSASCEVTVTRPADVPVFEDDSQEFTVSVNKTATINTGVLYEGQAVDAILSFSSDDENVATVSETGVITGVGVGTTQIQVSAEYLGELIYMSVDVEVRVNVNVEAPAQNVNLGTATINGTNHKDETELFVKVFVDDVDVSATTEVTWTLTGDCVSMTTNGTKANIKSLSAGTATVKADFTLYGKDYGYTFTVNVAKTTLTLTPDADRNMTVDLTAIDGVITALTVGETSHIDALSNGILTLDRDVVRGGTYAVTVTTATAAYTFDIIVPIEEYTVTIPTGTGYTVTGETKVTEHNEYTFTVESTDKEIYNIKEVKVNGAAITGDAGVYTIAKATENIVIEVVVDQVVIVELSMENAGTPADFAAILNAKPEGYYVLTEHLQWNGATSVAVPSFRGVLDGKGYAIADFKIDQAQNNGTSYSSQLFGVNSGKIRNILFITNISNATAGDHEGGIICRNIGSVSNCYVEFTVNDTLTSYRKYGAIASENNSGGTITNCVVNFVMTSPAAVPSYVGTLVSYNNGGSALVNCYTLLNGATYQDATEVSHVGFSNGGSANGIVNFDDMAHFVSLKDDYGFDTADGWNEYWSIVGDTIIFGDAENQPTRPVPKEVFDVTLPTGDKFTVTGAAKVTEGNDYTFTVTAAEGYIIDTVTVNGEAVTLTAGSYTVPAVTAAPVITVTVKEKPADVKPTELNMTNAGTPAALKALLNATPDGHFVLTEDLDFAGAVWVGGTVFTGTLDGNGYSIKNFSINFNAGDDNGYCPYVFASNSGTIKNLKLVYSFDAAYNNHQAGLIKSNTGTVENVYFDITINQSTVAYNQLGLVASSNGEGGTIKNCIINVTVGSDVTFADTTAGLVSFYNNAATIENVYVVSGSSLPISAYAWGTATNNAIYADMAALTTAVTSFDSANGWSEYWSIADGAVVFAPKAD